jgi:hypothetical protein
VVQSDSSRPEWKTVKLTVSKDDPFVDFEVLKDFIPGSRKKWSDIRKPSKEEIKEEKKANLGWDAHPTIKLVGGKEYEFFKIGALAQALGKRPVTIRKWIDKEWLPDTKYRLPTKPGTLGAQRLYTRAQIEGLVKIAKEEKLLGEWTPDVAGSNFPQRAHKLFKEL